MLLPLEVALKVKLTSRQNAGLTLATRLTEDLTTSVLVMEAGPAHLDEESLRECRL